MVKHTQQIDLMPGSLAIAPPKSRAVVACIGVGLFCLLTILGAMVRVPLPGTPVPMTLQTAVVLFAGVALGARLGAFSQLLYLAIGLAGVPVFADSGAGPQYVFGATGGYLLGFVIVPIVVGRLTARSSGLKPTLAAAAVGTILIFTLGVGWLAISAGSVWTALEQGLLPFWLGAVLKCGLVVAAGSMLGPACRKVWR
ncbi:MAG: biotin transporter BioY [Planctomycetes bacterium]|nr:biotin transporter BioY [Planctomycetota bacterium]